MKNIIHNLIAKPIFKFSTMLFGCTKPKNEFIKMRLEYVKDKLILVDNNNGIYYEWNSNPKGMTLPELEKWVIEQSPEAQKCCPKIGIYNPINL